MTVLIEAAVDSGESAAAAERGGAHRLEVCADLDVGGTTPGHDLIRAVRANSSLRIVAMLRPRGGSFVHSANELAHMRRDLMVLLEARVDAVVLGVLDEHGTVNAAAVGEFVQLAGSTPIVFHKAFDVLVDRAAALETLVSLGVTRVLTSGGAPTALKGAHELARLRKQAAGRIEILAGGKVRGANVCELVAVSGVSQVHARAGDGADDSQIREIAEALRS